MDEKTVIKDLNVRIFNFDPTMAPVGKTVLTVMLLTRNFKYWHRLRLKEREKYRVEKERIAEKVIEALDRKLGHIKSNLEVWDVSTPATVYRYTNNWQGSFEGWVLSPKLAFKKMKKTLPGLENFYMAGQWVEPGGGLPTSLMSGRNVAQIICKKEGKKFQVSK